jgi:hypothetical protein
MRKTLTTLAALSVVVAVGVAGCVRRGVGLAASPAGATGPGPDALVEDAGDGPFRVLLFSRTAGFRHDSIPSAVAALTELGGANGYTTEATEDPTQFSPLNLARFRVVVFLLTTGVHSAADTEYDWPYYGALVGAYFKAHPTVQQASVRLEAADTPATAGLPSPWVRTDEWYDFRSNPRPNVTVLATVDESTYTGGTMGPDHPIAWTHPTPGGGRAFYTAMGHTITSYAEPLFRAHLAGAIRWVAGR